MEGLPWRGPGPGRPQLPLPPARLPLRRAGAWRKRWRYVAAFGEEMLAAGGVSVSGVVVSSDMTRGFAP